MAHVIPALSSRPLKLVERSKALPQTDISKLEMQVTDNAKQLFHLCRGESIWSVVGVV